jgi:hypothetical protein
MSVLLPPPPPHPKIEQLLTLKIVNMTNQKLSQELTKMGFYVPRDVENIHCISEDVFRRLSEEITILTDDINDAPVPIVLQGIVPFIVRKILKLINSECAKEFIECGLKFPNNAERIRQIMQTVFHKLIVIFRKCSEELFKIDE